eukprot:356791-Chlamydomonas_euryale.AAC.1
MIRRPPRSTQGVSSAASDVYKRQNANCARTTQTKGVERDPWLRLTCAEARTVYSPRLLY